MKRQTALTLIISASILLVFAATGYYYQLKASNRFQENMITLNNRLIRQQSLEISQMKGEYEELLYDWSNPIIKESVKIFDSAEQALLTFSATESRMVEYQYEHAVSNVERARQFMNLKQQADSCLITVMQVAIDFFTVNSTLLGLQEKDVLHKDSVMRALISTADFQTLETQSLSYSEERLYRSLLTLSFQHCLKRILSDSRAWGCQRGIVMDQYYPMILVPFVKPKPGELVETAIAIGSYTTSLNPDQVTLSVNGQSLKLGKDGTAPYAFIAGSGKNNRLRMKCTVQDPLTEEEYTGEVVVDY